MMEFREFLCEGEDFSLEKDFDQSRVIRVESEGGATFRASFGLIHEKYIGERIPSIDEKFYHLFTTSLFTDREEAITTLQGGDARHALDLMKEVSPPIPLVLTSWFYYAIHLLHSLLETTHNGVDLRRPALL